MDVKTKPRTSGAAPCSERAEHPPLETEGLGTRDSCPLQGQAGGHAPEGPATTMTERAHTDTGDTDALSCPVIMTATTPPERSKWAALQALPLAPVKV